VKKLDALIERTEALQHREADPHKRAVRAELLRAYKSVSADLGDAKDPGVLIAEIRADIARGGGPKKMARLAAELHDATTTQLALSGDVLHRRPEGKPVTIDDVDDKDETEREGDVLDLAIPLPVKPLAPKRAAKGPALAPSDAAICQIDLPAGLDDAGEITADAETVRHLSGLVRASRAFSAAGEAPISRSERQAARAIESDPMAPVFGEPWRERP
jgi:hypothetical protein